MKDSASEVVADCLASQADGLVMGYVVVCEVIGSDGDRRVWVDASPDQRATTTIGLLDYALTLERLNVVRSYEAEADE